MKNILLVLALVVSAASFAQETASDDASKQNYDKFKSKRGVSIFPEAGEFALGVSANSFLNYFGNLLSGGGSNSAPSFSNARGSNIGSSPLSAFSGQSFGISGKYIKTEGFAYRARVNFNVGNFTNATLVQKIETNTPTAVPSYGEDKILTNSGSILVGLGFEKRRGKDRAKGIYGAEAILGFSSSKSTYTYLNAIDLTGNTERRASISNGNQFLIGARAFIGVEYFFAPKISIGGELAYLAGLGIRSAGIEERERLVNGTTVELYETPFGQARVNAFYLGLDNFDANLNLNFYF